MAFGFARGDTFAYSSRTCAQSAPFNEVGLDFDPNFPGIDSATGVAAVRHLAEGRIVAVKRGGEKGTISVGNSTAATNFANSVKSLIANYGFDGVDIDLENGVNATYMAQALRSIRCSVWAAAARASGSKRRLRHGMLA